jgi:transcriptional regulator with XRE-family HTH domain
MTGPIRFRPEQPDNDYQRSFGAHIRSLRRARALTQDDLAKYSTLSPDTVRRVEHGSFAASITTLRKLCWGLQLSPATVFESFELGETDHLREILDLLRARTPAELALVLRVLRSIFDLPGEMTRATKR